MSQNFSDRRFQYFFAWADFCAEFLEQDSTFAETEDSPAIKFYPPRRILFSNMTSSLIIYIFSLETAWL